MTQNGQHNTFFYYLFEFYHPDLSWCITDTLSDLNVTKRKLSLFLKQYTAKNLYFTIKNVTIKHCWLPTDHQLPTMHQLTANTVDVNCSDVKMSHFLESSSCYWLRAAHDKKNLFLLHLLLVFAFTASVQKCVQLKCRKKILYFTAKVAGIPVVNIAIVKITQWVI